jgi:hypothetical protein
MWPTRFEGTPRALTSRRAKKSFLSNKKSARSDSRQGNGARRRGAQGGGLFW